MSAFREAEFERRLRRAEARLSKLEHWQGDVRDELDELDKLQRKYVPIVDGMIESEAIAKGVARELAARGTARWSSRERFVAIIVAFSAFAGFVLELVRVATG